MTFSASTSEQIEQALAQRLTITNKLYSRLEKEELLEEKNLILFRFYFDFSTAIETVLRNIANVLSEKSRVANYYIKSDNLSKSFFLSKEELRVLISIDRIINDANVINSISTYVCCVDMLKSFVPSFGTISNDIFFDMYDTIRKNRNKLAHGLYLVDVEYSRDMLYQYACVYYLLLEYYKMIENDEKTGDLEIP